MVVQGVLKCLLFFFAAKSFPSLEILQKAHWPSPGLYWREINRMTLTMQACRYQPSSGTIDTPRFLGFGDNSC